MRKDLSKISYHSDNQRNLRMVKAKKLGERWANKGLNETKLKIQNSSEFAGAKIKLGEVYKQIHDEKIEQNKQHKQSEPAALKM